MGEQALRVQFYELRRLHELPEDVQIVGILPELPDSPEVAYVDCGLRKGPRPVLVYDSMDSPPLPPEWVPHKRAPAINSRCLYVHIQHRYCVRGAELGAPLMVDTFDEFLKRFASIAATEKEQVGKPLTDVMRDNGWVEDDA